MKKISFFDFTIFVLLLGVLSFFSHLNAETEDSAGSKNLKWESLMNLINQEIQTIKASKASGPDLRHRLFELYSEKIKLIKEKENSIFLKADPKRVAEKGKDFFFKSSAEQFQNAQTFGLSIIKEYPRYEKNNEIYYALAVNTRDYGTGKEAENFLLLSLKSGTKNIKIAYNARVGLAEYYYNEKKYNQANIYYDEILKTSSDEWYSKHLYNSSWCHLKERNFNKALSLIKESYEIASQKKNEGIKSQILNAIAIFFVQADATLEGVSFYTKNAHPSSSYLMALAKSSRSKNDFPLTDSVYKVALDNSTQEKNTEQEMKIRLELLELYRENKKTDLFVNMASTLVEINKKQKISSDNILAISNKIKELAGFMQVNLVKDKLQETIVYNKEDYNKIIKLFNYLGSLDKENKNLYRYYQGETAFSVGDFRSANKFYFRSILITKRTKKYTPQTIKTIDSLLTSIELAKLTKTNEDRLTIFALKNFVIFYPKSDRSQKIYQKLFSKYFELKQYKRATNILLVYQDQYPKDQTIHKEMLTQILDIYIKAKNTELLTTWVNIIDKGFLNFPNSFVQNSIVVLGNLLFEKNQLLEKNKKFREARIGYEAIYDSKFYPQKIKSEAAYAMASVFLQENKSKESLKWFKKSMEKYPEKDLIKTTGNIYNMANNHRLLQNFENSTEISKMMLKKFCVEEFEKKNEFYELVLTNTTIENDSVSDLIKMEKEYSKCKLDEKKVAQTQTEIISLLISGDQQKNLLKYIDHRELNNNSTKIVGNYLQFKFWQDSIKNIEFFRELSAQYPNIPLQNTIAEYDSLVAHKEKISSVNFVFSVSEKFDEDKYNSELEQYLAIVNDLTNDAIKLANASSPEVVLELQAVLTGPYKSLQESILKFQPKGVDEKYLKGFNLGMRQISESLSAKILQFDNEKELFFDKKHFFFEVKKHATLGREKMNIEQTLDFHSAILHSQTVESIAEKK
jgi:hypothetical protein